MTNQPSLGIKKKDKIATNFDKMYVLDPIRQTEIINFVFLKTQGEI